MNNKLTSLMTWYRDLLGLSQGMAARKAGISRSHWQRIEAGRCECKPVTARSILQALGVPKENTPADYAVIDELSFSNWTRCPRHPNREIPVRGMEAFCARCAGWHSVAGILNAENSYVKNHETVRTK